MNSQVNQGSGTFVVTTDWINQHRTIRGSFTDYQVQVLCGTTRPGRGWTKWMHNTEISEERRLQFEAGRFIYHSEKKRIDEGVQKDSTPEILTTKCPAVERANNALDRYLRNPSKELEDQILDTASLDVKQTWARVFQIVPEIHFKIQAL